MVPFKLRKFNSVEVMDLQGLRLRLVLILRYGLSGSDEEIEEKLRHLVSIRVLNFQKY